ncbi:hypothetical protein [Nitratireductor basaltis]|uniref:Uncharacterized protein n=1 Tax=Nitratireductor basaltis TaxID=472175 RepID=A0A084U8H7_9HYPH|nr:hypothetical protein [Nitratireductor basaltis]KFB09263.1 hypothetical protein EL18_00278 [Nitratireductor basaltis]
MFTPSDHITEVVAHFIGLFHVGVEDLRFRSDYHDFRRKEAAQKEDPAPEARPAPFAEKLRLDPYGEENNYSPPDYKTYEGQGDLKITIELVNVDLPPVPEILPPQPHSGALPAFADPELEPFYEPPGSTIMFVSQIHRLHDDDVLVVDGETEGPVDRTASHDELESLVLQAISVSAPIADATSLRPVGEVEAIFREVTEAAQFYEEFHFEHMGDVHVAHGAGVEGQHINGVASDEEPDLLLEIEALQGADEGEDDASLLSVASGDELSAGSETPGVTVTADEGSASITIDASKTPMSMDISSGGNVSINEVTIINAGLAPGSLIVSGDYRAIDAIVQTNVLRDNDSFGGELAASAAASAKTVQPGGNIVKNIAKVTNTDYETHTGALFYEGEAQPTSWNVSYFDDDMYFMDWISQYSFTSDHDTQVLTSIGTWTNFSTGANEGYNSLSFTDIGRFYDLVVVGGSIYDGNIINQTNILLDSDVIHAGGTGSNSVKVDSGHNLLWNEASILNIGAGKWQTGLTGHYKQAAEHLAGGNNKMPDGFNSDPAFAGIAAMDVLYIRGNVFDLRVIEQINIVGDADQLAIHQTTVANIEGTSWSVSTGSNVLANKAAIVDYDMVGQIAQVGGKIYSDAVLVQAELVDVSVDQFSNPATKLANEVVAFLDVTEEPNVDVELPAIPTGIDTMSNNDVLQTMLA